MTEKDQTWAAEPRRAIEDDIVKGLGAGFAALDEGFRFREDLFGGEPLDTDRYSVAAWEYEAVQQGPFLGLPATGRRVKIEGLTVFDKENGLYHRYIDWAMVLAQLGVTLTSRPVSDPMYADPKQSGA